MIISIQQGDGGSVIFLKGRLDAVTSPKAWVELEQHAETVQGPIILGCEELQYLSSAGLRVLLNLANKGNRELVLMGLSGNVREVIEIAGFSCIFKMR